MPRPSSPCPLFVSSHVLLQRLCLSVPPCLEVPSERPQNHGECPQQSPRFRGQQPKICPSFGNMTRQVLPLHRSMFSLRHTPAPLVYHRPDHPTQSRQYL